MHKFMSNRPPHRAELAILADQAQQAADLAMIEAGVAYQAWVDAKEERKNSNAKAAELMREAARARIRYLRASGAEMEAEEEGDATIELDLGQPQSARAPEESS